MAALFCEASLGKGLMVSHSPNLAAFREFPALSAARIKNCSASWSFGQNVFSSGLQWQQTHVKPETSKGIPLRKSAVSAYSHDHEEWNSEDVMKLYSEVMVQTYAPLPIVPDKGQGCWLIDVEGKEYLDMTAGIAVNALVHGDKEFWGKVCEQASALAHVSNLYYTVPPVKLAQRLVQSSFADRIFYANSGAEANEAAIKFARKYQRSVVEMKPDHDSHDAATRTEFVAFDQAFHGRTMGALALTSKTQYRTPFEPVMPGVNFVKFGDLDAVADVIKAHPIAAVFVEPVQGEGGVHPASIWFLQGLRKLCDETGTLLVFDEIQCGLGRLGTLFAYEAYDVKPDILTLAKPMGGGLAMGAVLMTEGVASTIAVGDHGSTFAGGPAVCTAALEVLDRLQGPGFLESVVRKGDDVRNQLSERLIGKNSHVKEIRGAGLLIGIQLDVSAKPVQAAAGDAGLLILTAGKGNVIRLTPPLTISEKELQLAIDILVKCLDQL